MVSKVLSVTTRNGFTSNIAEGSQEAHQAHLFHWVILGLNDTSAFFLSFSLSLSLFHTPTRLRKTCGQVQQKGIIETVFDFYFSSPVFRYISTGWRDGFMALDGIGMAKTIPSAGRDGREHLGEPRTEYRYDRECTKTGMHIRITPESRVLGIRHCTSLSLEPEEG